MGYLGSPVRCSEQGSTCKKASQKTRRSNEEQGHFITVRVGVVEAARRMDSLINMQARERNTYTHQREEGKGGREVPQQSAGFHLLLLIGLVY